MHERAPHRTLLHVLGGCLLACAWWQMRDQEQEANQTGLRVKRRVRALAFGEVLRWRWVPAALSNGPPIFVSGFPFHSDTAARPPPRTHTAPSNRVGACFGRKTMPRRVAGCGSRSHRRPQGWGGQLGMPAVLQKDKGKTMEGLDVRGRGRGIRCPATSSPFLRARRGDQPQPGIPPFCEDAARCC